jgi:hypothetical protein
VRNHRTRTHPWVHTHLNDGAFDVKVCVCVVVSHSISQVSGAGLVLSDGHSDWSERCE